jgi:predicted nucleic acid-binding protein
MTFDDIVSGLAIVVDANSFLYSFTAHPRFGPACQKLLTRIETGDIIGTTSAHVVGEVAHRLMSATIDPSREGHR